VAILRDVSGEFEITTEVVEGSPKRVILDEAEHWDPDSIVRSHGRRGI
jgi:nucleotide-binding universal stress UspA family protein